MTMTHNVMVLAGRVGEQVTDATFELVGKARELADAWGVQVEVVHLGPSDAAPQVDGADVVVSLDHPALHDYVPEAYERAMQHVLTERSPRLLLLPNDTMGLDLGAALSVTWDAALAAAVVGLVADGATPVATAQILGGKILVEVALTGDRAICTVVGGAFPAPGPGSGGATETVTLAAPAGLDSLRMSLEQTIEPQGGDVDITAVDLLVSVGRGIGSQDDLELVQELADALDSPLSASRPVIDAGWLPKTRQVGKSGLKVKPKAYLAFGISGAPEHLEGMRDAELIIACNTDEGAPIFDVAQYGSTTDLFDLVPALVERLGG
jgi:electron transfer flavoprotein alpha subunit